MSEGSWISDDYYEYEDAEMQEIRFLEELYEEDMRELDIMGSYVED